MPRPNGSSNTPKSVSQIHKLDVCEPVSGPLLRGRQETVFGRQRQNLENRLGDVTLPNGEPKPPHSTAVTAGFAQAVGNLGLRQTAWWAREDFTTCQARSRSEPVSGAYLAMPGILVSPRLGKSRPFSIAMRWQSRSPRPHDASRQLRGRSKARGRSSLPPLA